MKTIYLILIVLIFSSQTFAARRFTCGFEVQGSNTGAGPFFSGYPTADGWDYVAFGGFWSLQGGRFGYSNVSAQFANGSLIDPSYPTWRNFVRITDSISIKTACYTRIWLLLSQLHPPGTNRQRIVNLLNATETKSFALTWLQNGKLGMDVNGVSVDTSATAPATNQWFLVQMYTTWSTSNATNRIIVSGPAITLDTMINHTAPISSTDSLCHFYVGFYDGVSNGAFDRAFFQADDIGINDTLGSYENGAPDDSGVVFWLPPVSDTSRGGWRAGGGETTNLWDAIDNVPQLGDSVTETLVTNIMDTSNSASDDYQAAVMSYTTKGIPSNKTVRFVQVLGRHGEDSAVGTKAGAIRLVSNPSDAGEHGFNYGNDQANRHAKDNYAGSGDTKLYWYTAFGNIVYNPTINRSVRPVVLAGKRTATTRKVCVDLLGILGEYGNSYGPTTTQWKRIIKQ